LKLVLVLSHPLGSSNTGAPFCLAEQQTGMGLNSKVDFRSAGHQALWMRESAPKPDVRRRGLNVVSFDISDEGRRK
jgi:hypothetical protein